MVVTLSCWRYFFFKKCYLFIYFWLHLDVHCCTWALSLVVAPCQDIGWMKRWKLFPLALKIARSPAVTCMIENTLPNPHTYSQLIFDKGDKNTHWREDSLFSKWWWESWTFAAIDKSMKLEHSLTPCTKIPQDGLKDTTWLHKVPRRENRQNILWYKLYQYFLRSVSEGNKNKNRSKQMRPSQICKLWNSKGNLKKNEKTTTYRPGENIYKWCNQQGFHFQNIWTAYITQ